MNHVTTLDLQDEAFSSSPNPRFFYRSLEHYSALNRLEIAIRLKRGLSVILGDVGTGKTTLWRTLLKNFEEDEDRYIFHVILDPAYSTESQFLLHLAKIFGVSPVSSTVDCRAQIEEYLFQKHVVEQKTVVLIIDEGQKLSLASLEILRSLLNYETNESKMLQLVILAQLEIIPRLQALKNFVDRIAMKYELKPLDLYETGQMIFFRLQQTGIATEKTLFSLDAIQRVYEYTQGYPRQIAHVCHYVMEKRFIGGYSMVTKELIDQVIAEDRLWK